MRDTSLKNLFLQDLMTTIESNIKVLEDYRKNLLLSQDVEEKYIEVSKSLVESESFLRIKRLELLRAEIFNKIKMLEDAVKSAESS